MSNSERRLSLIITPPEIYEGKPERLNEAPYDFDNDYRIIASEDLTEKEIAVRVTRQAIDYPELKYGGKAHLLAGENADNVLYLTQVGKVSESAPISSKPIVIRALGWIAQKVRGNTPTPQDKHTT